MQRAVCSVQCSDGSVQCVVHCEVYSVQCSVHCEVYSVQWTVSCVYCSVREVQCSACLGCARAPFPKHGAVHSVKCKVYSDIAQF